MSLREKIENLEDKPAINKKLREAWKIVYPIGTIPRKTSEMKEEVISFLEWFEQGTTPEHLENTKEPFLTFITEIVE
jgi:hypothetical protein